jgi:pimeloyl-ACP methyl ester carboxylesterase
MARHWTRWVAGALGVSVGVAGGALWRWKRRRLAALAAVSELVETERGTVEVARRGSGYPVLILHGAPGGYDQVLSFGDGDASEIEVIAPSRPGYLRTPLADDRSPSAQAALFVALLDELGIERAVVVGLSSGGPAALHLAAEYPDRVAGLLLLCAITTDIDERTFDTGDPLLDPILTSTPVLDLYAGLFVLLRRFGPERLVALTHELFSTLEGAELDAYVASVLADPDHRERDLALISSLFPVGDSRGRSTTNTGSDDSRPWTSSASAVRCCWSTASTTPSFRLPTPSSRPSGWRMPNSSGSVPTTP